MDAIECPCGTGLGLADCCGAIHERGAGLGKAAVTLMRARYTAYVRCDERFLLGSWHPETRPATVPFDRRMRWLGLEIVETIDGTGLDNEGIVEFRARYERRAGPGEVHERSRFVRVGGQWRYLDGS